MDVRKIVSMKPILPYGVYGIISQEHSKGRDNLDVVKAMLAGGIRVIQYREKSGLKSQRRMLDECRAIRHLTRAAGVLLIVNDHVDLAMLADADGVHVGQDDLPVADVRQLVGPDMLIGLSTHSPEQARQAYREGADYIGVGPIYETRTKANVAEPVGLACLRYVVQHVPLPAVAIGGIKTQNVKQVIEHGARCVCMITEIVGADDIAATVRHLNNLIGP